MKSAKIGFTTSCRVASGITWPVFPFLIAVYVLAIALARIGVVEWLHALWTTSEVPIATIGATNALGSAVLNNHPMSVLAALALDGDKSHAFAALVGGNLGPRLLPIGSLASLLWFDLLRVKSGREAALAATAIQKKLS